ncbi:UBA/THIF-type NAD/FAD binding protein [Nitzschia inconspicua]|uniref:UBA/THIF-type NAD/FAD binding protein n=1 Tax=Nitzschia inconspicua TaxID=303405 RepID=A0A9K3L4L8_9STRA|nr:UBA/THIF-type NAD/FAD binding protein [Nitzschia inconspicua]
MSFSLSNQGFPMSRRGTKWESPCARTHHICYSTSSLSNDEISRYSRHLVLSDVGMKGQVALKNSSVLVIGAGELGSPCLLYLAAAGVGHVGIVDADTVDASNLQRQIIHGTSTVGVSKCESARRRIQDINPHVKTRLYQEEFTSETALRILKGGFEEGRPYDVVIDGSDNFPTKYLINDACDIVGVPWVYSAILAFEGQLSVFNYQNGPTYRDMLPTPPPPGDVPSCAEGGVLGVLPGTMGCLQATEVIKILLGKESICSGRVLTFDALKMKFGQIGLAKRENREVITELIDYQGFCGGPKTAKASSKETNSNNANIMEMVPSTTQEDDKHAPTSFDLLKAKAAPRNGTKDPKLETATSTPLTTGRSMDEAESTSSNLQEDAFHSIDPKKCLDKLVDGWTPWVLDVRLPTEHDIVALPFTDRVVPHRSVELEHIPKSGDVLVYCKGGVRGKKACNKLVELGVDADRLYNLEGGIMRWQDDVDSSMPRY